jgi:hypothetical protein
MTGNKNKAILKSLSLLFMGILKYPIKLSRKLIKRVSKARIKDSEKDFREKNGQALSVSVADLFFLQFDGDELTRLDIAVRYLAIENYYGLNSIGFDLYEKMQKTRSGNSFSGNAGEKFRLLIDSFEKNGYDENSSIVCDNRLRLFDGSHRIALSIFHNVYKINVIWVDRIFQADYTIDWFFKNGFTFSEIDAILDKKKELCLKLNNTFSCIIWAPAAAQADKLINGISYYGRVENIRTYKYSNIEYNNIVRAIYHIDDIDNWKIEKKIEHMSQYEKLLTTFELRLPVPSFRIKESTHSPLCIQGERLKKTFRSRYQSEIKDYFFDIILHIGDNYFQSNYMRGMLDFSRDISDCFLKLENHEYVICKYDTPYMPKDFPWNIPFHKDIDVLCAWNDYQSIVNDIRDYSERYSKENKFDLVIMTLENRTKIRIESESFLILQFDISRSVKGLQPGFISSCVANRLKHGIVYIADKRHEYVIRLNEIASYPDKMHHQKYLLDNNCDLDIDFARGNLEYYQNLKKNAGAE